MGTAEKILKNYRTVAVVGASANPERPSHRVTGYLIEQGYHVIPVNPNTPEVLGMASYPDLGSIPEPVDVVDIFRRSEDVMPLIDEAIRIGAKAVWMQEGIINKAAANRARDAGLLVVMDKCMFKEHRRLAQNGRLNYR